MNFNLANIIDDIPEIGFPIIPKQAVSKARMAVLPALFKTLFHHSVQKLYQSDYSRKTWHGFHVFAIDGSKIQVQKPKTTSSILDYAVTSITAGKMQWPVSQLFMMFLKTSLLMESLRNIILDDGTDECLMTNIMDPKITVDMFKELYFLRWGIESKYNELKNKLELEEFSGSSHNSVEQDFFIHLLFINICALIKSDADEKISGKSRFLIGRLKKHLASLLSGFKDINYWIEILYKQAIKRRSQIQPEQKCKRPRIQLRRRHCKNRKTTT